MMNNNIFSAIVVELNNLNDSQGAQILSIIKGFQSTPVPVTPKLMSPEDKMEKILQGIADGEYPREKGLAELKEIKKSLGLSIPEEKPEPKPLRGKSYWTEDMLSVREVELDGKKSYIVYLTVPQNIWKKDEKTGKMKNIAGWLRDKLKDEFKKEYEAKFAGNYDDNEFFWAFPSKKKADEYVKARKEWHKANDKKSA